MIRSSFLLSLVICFFFFSLKGQECEYIYVTSSGTSSSLAGTRSNPASLQYALSIVSSTDSIIKMAEGTYWLDSTLNMVSNISIEGGFDSVSWIKSNTTPSILYRKNTNISLSPDRLIAVNAVGKTNFNLTDLTIKTDSAAGNGVSVYGIYLSLHVRLFGR